MQTLDNQNLYPDTQDSPYREEIASLTNQGIFEGYPDKTFRPHKPITRTEALKILFKASNTQTREISNYYLFSDTDATQWYYPYVHEAYMQGFVEGYEDGSFHPAGNITRAEFLKLTIKMFELINKGTGQLPYTDVTPNDWFYETAQIAHAHDLTLFASDGTLKPNEALMREEAAFIIYTAQKQ